MAKALYTNNAIATLNAGINGSVTTIVLTAGQGAAFPNPAGGDYFYATLVDAATQAIFEILKVTARSTDTLTVVRGQQGTSGTAYLALDRLELRPTAYGYSELAALADATFDNSAVKVKGSSTGVTTVASANAGASDYTVTVPATTTALAGLAVAETFTAPQRGAITTDNDGSFDESVGNNFKCTPTATFALTFTNHASGHVGNVILVNTGGYAVTAAATTKIATATLTAISTAGTYLLGYVDDGTNAYVTASGALV